MDYRIAIAERSVEHLGRTTLPSGLPTPEQALNNGIRTLKAMSRAYGKKGESKSASIATDGVRKLEQAYRDNAIRHEASKAGRTFDVFAHSGGLSRLYIEITRDHLERAESASSSKAGKGVLDSLPDKPPKRGGFFEDLVKLKPDGRHAFAAGALAVVGAMVAVDYYSRPVRAAGRAASSAARKAASATGGGS